MSTNKFIFKILDPCYDEHYHSFQYFFDLNADEFIFQSDCNYSESVDFLVCNHFYHLGLDSYEIIKKYRYRTSIFLDIKHNLENQISQWLPKLDSSLHDYTITNAVDLTASDSRIIFNDHLFNRTKAYYLGYNWRPDSNVWYYRPGAYIIPRPTVGREKTKIFIAPNRTHNNTREYRTKLVENLFQKHLASGYLGSFDYDSNLKLYSQLACPTASSINDLHSKNLARYQHQGYSPPHQLYYEDTFISVYAETIEYGSTFAPTEKTFDPLIKGHFILPFSNPGFINFLKTFYGFQFPEFVDYSYDAIEDDHKRFEYYIKELDRLIALSNWPDLWDQNQHIIQHNQQIFYTRPYHRINFTQYLS